MAEEERSSKFLNAIERCAKEQQKALQAKFRDIRKNELNIAEAEALRDAYYLIQEKMVKMHKSIASEISRSELKNKRVLLEKREEIKDEVFEKAKVALLDVTRNESEYLKILEKSIQKISEYLSFSEAVFYVKSEDIKYSEQKISEYLSFPEAVFYVKSEDIKYSDYIKEMYGKPSTVKVDESIVIGGIVAENQKLGIIVNETLDEKLELQKLWFMQNSELKVM